MSATPQAAPAGSLRRRALLALTIILLAFFGATIVVLDASLGASLAGARAEVLEAQLMALIAAAEPAGEKASLRLPSPTERRLLSPDSGLYAEIRNASGRPVWRSPSALGIEIAAPPPGAAGERRGATVAPDGGPELAIESLAVDWVFEDGRVAPFQFVVAQSLAPWRAQQRAFRTGLVISFGLLALALLAVVTGVLGRTLRPLARIEAEIRDMEAGARDALSPGYPRELDGVARNLNALLARERRRQQRYRDSLADLAHSLKTPLATMRALMPPAQARSPALERMDAELSRMDRIIAWQLKRAVAGGGPAGMAAVTVAPVARDLADSLAKVHRDRPVTCDLAVAPSAVFRGAEGDLQEILGNLMDNAWKYARGRVRCRADMEAGGALVLQVGDDGPGLDPARAEEALTRGTRLDESRPGHGIGLAVVREIVAAYGGSLRIGRSEAGGALVTVRIPPGGELRAAAAAGQDEPAGDQGAAR